jgi:hypothetical protein
MSIVEFTLSDAAIVQARSIASRVAAAAGALPATHPSSLLAFESVLLERKVVLFIV